jgi:TatD DNase family protein
MIKQHRDKFTHGVVHSFTGTQGEMEQLVQLGLYIGINGCSLKTQENLDVVKAIPQDRLMIETGISKKRTVE